MLNIENNSDGNVIDVIRSQAFVAVSLWLMQHMICHSLGITKDHYLEITRFSRFRSKIVVFSLLFPYESSVKERARNGNGRDDCLIAGNCVFKLYNKTIINHKSG